MSSGLYARKPMIGFFFRMASREGSRFWLLTAGLALGISAVMGVVLVAIEYWLN